MKKLSFVLFIICTASLSAQKNKLDIGIAAAPNYNYLYGFDGLAAASYGPLMAFSAGLTVQYNLPKVVSFVSGFFYEKKGETVSGHVIYPSGNQEAFKVKYFFNYITVPLLARFSFGKKIKFFAEGGGFVSYLTRSYTRSSGTAVNYSNDNTTFFYKRPDAGVSAGLGISLPLGEKLLLNIEARNNLGLMNISVFPVYNNKSLKTNSINLLVNLAYKLGKRSV